MSAEKIGEKVYEYKAQLMKGGDTVAKQPKKKTRKEKAASEAKRGPGRPKKK